MSPRRKSAASPQPRYATITTNEAGYNLRRTCKDCPWLKSSPLGTFSPQHFEEARGVAGPGDGMRNIFGCHNTVSDPQVCVGYLLVEGGNNFAVRMQASEAGVRREALEASGELYSSFEEMAQANGCAPDESLWHEELKLVRMAAWLHGADPDKAEAAALRTLREKAQRGMASSNRLTRATRKHK